MFVRSSTGLPLSRTQIVGYIAGVASVLLGGVELLGFIDIPFVTNPLETIQYGLAFFGISFLRAAPGIAQR